jgi:cation diffusion facilitator CzcD-associated flavoprotein CzcO
MRGVQPVANQVTSLTKMGLKNKDGVDIKDVWQDGIRTYLGMTFNGFPNCFMVYTPHGPYSPPCLPEIRK